MFYNRLERVQEQLAALQATIKTLEYKCWYYDTALAAGTEDVVKNLPEDKIPEELRKYRI